MITIITINGRPEIETRTFCNGMWIVGWTGRLSWAEAARFINPTK